MHSSVHSSVAAGFLGVILLTLRTAALRARGAIWAWARVPRPRGEPSGRRAFLCWLAPLVCAAVAGGGCNQAHSGTPPAAADASAPGDSKGDGASLATLTSQIDERREKLARLQIQLAHDASVAAAQYKSLGERRKNLRPGDNAATAAFNRDAAAYQAQSDQLRTEKAQVEECDHALADLLSARAKLSPPPPVAAEPPPSPRLPSPPSRGYSPRAQAPRSAVNSGTVNSGGVVTKTVPMNERVSMSPNGETARKLIIRLADHTNGLVYSIEDDGGEARKTFLLPSGATSTKIYRPASTYRKPFDSKPIPGTTLEGVLLADGVYLVDEIGGGNQCVLAFVTGR